MFEALGAMSLDLLLGFEAAARLRSFTAAAIELGTTQPAISQQIKRLEEQLERHHFLERQDRRLSRYCLLLRCPCSR